MPGNDIGAGIQHALGEAFGVEAFGLEVLEHCPGAPPAHELGLHGIDPGPNEGHTATVAEGAGADVAGLKAHYWGLLENPRIQGVSLSGLWIFQIMTSSSQDPGSGLFDFG